METIANTLKILSEVNYPVFFTYVAPIILLIICILIYSGNVRKLCNQGIELVLNPIKNLLNSLSIFVNNTRNNFIETILGTKSKIVFTILFLVSLLPVLSKHVL